jgi:Legionella pneumophila major outer membrane protein precursor
MPARNWTTLAAAALYLALQAGTGRAADPTWSSSGEGPETLPALPNELVVSDQDYYQPSTDVAFTIGIPNLAPGMQFHAGPLFLKPSADNLGYAVLTTEENEASPVPLATPLWQVETLNPSFSPGFEVGANYTFAESGQDFQANWQHLRSTTSSSAAVAQESGQWISPFSQTGPPTAADYQDLLTHDGVNDLLSATGQVKFSYDAVNLDFGQYVRFGPALAFRMFAGLSYANLQERMVSSFFGAPPAPDAVFPESVPLELSLNNTSSFWGIGPRFGFEAARETPSGFRFTGQLAGALLIGQTQPAQYLFTATAPDLALVGIPVNEERISSDRFTQVVYAGDAKLGIGYARSLSGGSVLTVDGGYLAAIYLNPFSGYETNENILALQIGSLSSGSVRQTLSDFTANGFYLNAGLKW